MSQALFLAGQTLAAGEPAAVGVKALSRAQRRALRLCLAGERLDFAGPHGWRHPVSTAVTVDHRTIASLQRAGLAVVIKRSRFRQHARLTARGDWYARSLVTEAQDFTRRIVRPTGGT